jgi:hypothetical protein
MAQSQQAAIRAAVAALMHAGTPLCGGRIHENRAFQLPQGAAAQLHVNYRQSDPERIAFGGNPIDWTTEIELVIKTRAVGGVTAEDAADAIWVDAFARLMADQSLGGLVSDLQPGTAAAEDDQADTGTCRLTWSFTVQHRTEQNSLA